jgi:hypothetical protein
MKKKNETYAIDPKNVTVARLLYCVQESLRFMSADAPIEGVRLNEAAQVAQRMMTEKRPLCDADFQGLSVKEVGAILGSACGAAYILRKESKQLQPAEAVATALEIIDRSMVACYFFVAAASQSANAPKH